MSGEKRPAPSPSHTTDTSAASPEAHTHCKDFYQLALELGELVPWEMSYPDYCLKTSGAILALLRGSVSSPLPEVIAFFPCIHPDDREATHGILMESISDGQERTHAFRVVWLDGSTHWIEVRSKVLRDASGLPQRLLGVARSIDARKAAENALRQALETEDFLSSRLHTLSEIERELSHIESFDALCRRAVELGRSHLGFERLGLWFLRENGRSLQGSFGTDTKGQIRDERHLHFSMGYFKDYAEGYKQPLVILEHTIVHEPDGSTFGPCCLLHAPLWDGENVIGILSADNLLTLNPIPERQRELLRIYATTFAALCTRLQVAEAIKRREQEFRTLLDNLPESIARFDRHLRYIYYSPPVGMQDTLSPSLFLGKTDRERNTLPEEVLCRWEQTLRETFVTGRPARFDWEYESLLTPEFGENGTVETVLVCIRDMRERQRMEQELRESNQQLRLAMRAGRMGIVDRDLTTGKVRWSEELMDLFGVTPDQFDGTLANAIAYLHPEDRANLQETEILETDENNFTIEYRMIRTDGAVRWVQSHGHILRNPQGQPERVIAVVQDVTERKLLQEQYLHAQKMESIGKLAGGIAHDFNNLLTAILGFAELAEESETNSSSCQVYLANIKSAANRAANLTRQLLAFARKQMIMPQVITLDTLITDLSTLIQRLIGEDIILTTRMSSHLWTIYADPGQIEQVLINLIVNSRDAMPGGGILIIETENVTLTETGSEVDSPPPGDYVLLAVRDTGTGMSAEVKKRIFEPFFTTKEVGKGTGLGLATCYGIIRQSNGYIQVFSEPGQGTTINILLPRRT